MKIAYITAGAAGMYCGTCMHDNTLAAALMERGHEVSLIPTYTPMRTDETNVAQEKIFFGALNVYLQQKGILRKSRFLDKLLDSKRVLTWVGKLSGKASTDAADLGDLTLSMIQGEAGHQARELEKLIDFMEEHLQPEIVHLSTTLFAGFAKRIKERLGVPVVCSLQGEDLFFEDLTEPWKSRVLSEITRRAEDIDAFTSPCDYYSRLMSENYGVPLERTFRGRLGIQADEFQDVVERDADRHPVLGYLARQAPEKGLHHLVDAFLILAQEHPGLRLRVAGFLGPKDEAFVARQKAKLEQAGMMPRVDWVGEIDRGGKVDFLRSVDIFSVPTVYREPKGLFVPEALASGLPVILPDHGAFPEWVRHTGGGLLVKPESPRAVAAAVAELLGDPERRRALGAQGREAVLRDFNQHAMADEMLDLYERILSGEVRARPAAA
ncbi:MAG: glycosyltransferase family 4 protein [Acidobacteriota bacterium]